VRVASLGLTKSFSRKPAYWLEIYHSPKGKWGNSWYVARQWSFTKDGQVVEGQTLSNRFSVALSAIEHLRELLQKKLGENWNVHNLTFDSAREIPKNEMTVINVLKELAKDKAELLEVPSPPVVVETRATRIKNLQSKRKAKAQW
jgi:hypothetical protein